MSNSSVQPDYSTILTDTISTITIDPSKYTSSITMSNASSNYYYSTVGATGNIGNITLTGGGVNISSAGSSFENIWKGPTEFIDSWPDWTRIEKMCKEYPGLEIAFQKFKTTYYLVKDEYDNPKDKK